MRSPLALMGAEPMGNTPAQMATEMATQMAAQIAGEVTRFGDLARKAELELD